MDALILKVIFFLLAVGILVTVHEFGHFWVARKLGVKVLRFSIGFGKPLWRRTAADGTEYVVAMLPLGGYVRMLDEREGKVSPEEREQAFNRKSLSVRSAVVVAGPLFNFLFAIVAFWLVLIMGETGTRPLVGSVAAAAPAAGAGFEAGDEILRVNGNRTPTWPLVIQELAAASVSGAPVQVRVRTAGGLEAERLFPADSLGDLAEVDDLLAHVGVEPERPNLPAVIGEVLPGEPAAAAGLLAGDRILESDGQAVSGWSDWVDYIQARPGEVVKLTILREGAELELGVVLDSLVRDGKVIGRIGAGPHQDPDLLARYRAEHRLGPLEAVPAAAVRVVEYSVLTLKVIWRIITGEASVHNLSGPLTIADAAGKTASIGATYFIKFLAIVSISLGVLNLLPVPVLDGGHLLYFAIEAVIRRPLSEEFMIQGQKIGLVLLLGLMSLAFYVDIQRFFG